MVLPAFASELIRFSTLANSALLLPVVLPKYFLGNPVLLSLGTFLTILLYLPNMLRT